MRNRRLSRLLISFLLVLGGCDSGGSTSSQDTLEPPEVDATNTDTVSDVVVGESPFGEEVVGVKLELTAEAWAAILAAPLDETFQQGAIEYDGVRVENVGIRVKGNSSLKSVADSGSTRFSFKVDMNEYVSGQKLLGVKKLNFNNSFKDPTFLREVLGYEVAPWLGLPAPRTTFADLTVAGTHLGLFVVVEQVDSEFIERTFQDTTGDLYKPEPPAGGLAYTGDDALTYTGLELKTNETTSDHSAFMALLKALDSQDAAMIEASLDVDRAISYLAMNAVLTNLDSYNGPGHNYYLYEEGGRFTVIPWDMNEAFGAFNCGCDRTGLVEYPIDEPSCGRLSERPLLGAILDNAEWRAAYHERMRAVLDGPLAEPGWSARIAELADRIRPTVQADPTKFYSETLFEQALTQDVTLTGPMAAISLGLGAFAAERGASVRAQLAGTTPSTAATDGACPSNSPNPCGDGVCDAFETANPQACPRDCGG